MKRYLSGIGVIFGLEIRQRIHGVASYVLLGIFFVLVGVVTFLLLAISNDVGASSILFSFISFFILLLGTLVTPALSGNAVNGEREAGTLATTQVTLVSAGQLILGKFLAAWLTAFVFVVVSIPFILLAMVHGRLPFENVAIAIAVLTAELGVIAALGVGFSAIIGKPLFSVATAFLAVASLTILTLIAFALLGGVTRTSYSYSYSNPVDWDGDTVASCSPPQTDIVEQPRFDRYWVLLAMNPFVVLADAVPANLERPQALGEDLFTLISVAVREVQYEPDVSGWNTECVVGSSGYDDGYSDMEEWQQQRKERYYGATSVWGMGLGTHVLLGAGALLWGWSRTRTPYRKLAAGTRVA